MIDHPNVLRLPGLLIACAAMTLSACGRTEPEATAAAPTAGQPPAAELADAACTGARGELAELASVTGGVRPFANASLRTQFLDELAVVAQAPAAVQADLVQWKSQVDARQQALRDIPPRFENGRLLEPDTAPLDRQFAASMQPVSERLGAWVGRTCASQARAPDASASLLTVQSAKIPA